MAKETLVLVRGDVSREAARPAGHPKRVKVGGAKFEVHYEMDKSLAKKLDTDARFVQKLKDDLAQDYHELVARFAKQWYLADLEAGILPFTDADRRELRDE